MRERLKLERESKNGDTLIYRQTDRQTDRHTDRQTGRQADRQIDDR